MSPGSSAHRMPGRPLGVGLIGAGPVTQAIHLPTLATLGDRLRVTHVMDVDPDVAASVAARAATETGAGSGPRRGVRHSTTAAELLADDAVDVVAICSPHAFHAEQIAAAVAAGKRGILCEKPLATNRDEAERIAKVTSDSGVPVVVGAMQAYDPAWNAVRREWGDLPERAHLIRSRVYLPGNEEFVALATDPAPAAPPPAGGPGSDADMLRAGILGLATHVVPQLRHFLPGPVRVVSARFLSPFGYRLVLTADDEHGAARTAELTALMPGVWEPDWTFEAWAPGTRLRVAYPPSYVLAGSATATLTDASGSSRDWQFPVNGYQAEWLHLADIVDGRTEPLIGMPTAIADMVYALELADGATALLEDPS